MFKPDRFSCSQKIQLKQDPTVFKITGMLKPENVKLNLNYIFDTLEIDWKEQSKFAKICHYKTLI